jgi:hypothetical protein
VKQLLVAFALLLLGVPAMAGVKGGPNSLMAGHEMAEVVMSEIPVAHPGTDLEKLGNEQGVPPTQYTTESGGAFRTTCFFSHFTFDDPIVYPNQPGVSHLHTVFGNDALDAYTDLAALLMGKSNCRGGALNRTALWVPSSIDLRTGKPLSAQVMIYYKWGHLFKRAQHPQLSAVPFGLKMVAGAKMTDDAPVNAGKIEYKCVGWNTPQQYGLHKDTFEVIPVTTETAAVVIEKGTFIPPCPGGTKMWQVIYFPECWNGVDLDSADHRSHMSYPTTRWDLDPTGKIKSCPATHPVALPKISYEVIYDIPVGDPELATNMGLSSDMYAATGRKKRGYSLHADYFMAWKQTFDANGDGVIQEEEKGPMDVFMANCVNVMKDCHAELLGNGKMLLTP